MKILALEFSSALRSVAVWAGGQLRGRAEEREGRGTKALALIESSLDQARLEREQIDCIAVGLGPGSYAGVRIAIALAQGWQLARGVKLLGLSSADCVAAQAQAAGWRGCMELVLDAQRHGFYCARYEIATNGWRETAPFHVLAPKGFGPGADGGGPLTSSLSPTGGEGARRAGEGDAPAVQGHSAAPVALTFVVRTDPGGQRSQDERILCPDAAMLAQLASGRTDFIAGEALAPIYLVESIFVKAPPPRIIR